MDKSFKKEEYLESERKQKSRRTSSDVDEIRKKAFGPVGENFPRKTTPKREENYFKEDTKSIDDLLKDSIDETIELNFDDPEPYEDNVEETRTSREYREPALEDLDNTEDFANFEELQPKRSKRANYEEDLPKRKEVKEEASDLEDTLENDLYNLIDAMYDSREEE